ncbi:MAG: M28 family peptidase, partial [Caldilineaceae bacterium]
MIAQRQSTTALEDQFLQELALDAPWSLIERFTSLVRESGSEEEREAAQYIAEQLDKFGVPYEVYDPEIYLSVPISASLVYEGKTVRAKPPAFSRPPGPQGLTGEAVYVPSTRPSSASNLFDSGGDIDIDVSGKIVVTEGLGLPAAVARFEAAGAIGQIHINPGVDIHWGICTTIWGAPDLDNAASQPKTTVISINRPDGEALIERLKQEPLEVTLYAELREGWFPCPIVVADIRGQLEPDRYVLVHGHYDSWDVGIGDNAVGDATLLELARVFHKKREHLARGLRVAWWPGHSTGRYGGSTWYADNFGLDLA